MTEKHKNTHGGAGRGQGRHPKGENPQKRIQPYIAEITHKNLESEVNTRGLEHIGQVLDQDYGPKTPDIPEWGQKTPESPAPEQDTVEPKEDSDES